MTLRQKYPTIISSWTLPLMETLEDCGLNSEQLLLEAGIEKRLLSNPDARVRVDKMDCFWRLAVKNTGDKSLGLTAAANVRPTTFHALGFALMVSNSLVDAFERLRRFYRLVSDTIELSLEYFEDSIAISLNPGKKALQPANEAIDMAMATIVLFARMLQNDSLNPEKVEFRCDQPTNDSKYHQIFQSPIIFNADNNRLFFKLKDVQLALPSANGEIARCNDQIVVEYLSGFDKSNISHQVYAKMIDLLPLGEPSIEKLARSLGMSSRSLHRGLKNENVKYRTLLEDIRKHFAAQYLKQPHFSIIEVAFRLGYSDSANFTRAFKRWYNMSPTQFREQSDISNPG